MKIKIIKFAKNLISPNRSHYNDAGADCFSPSNFKLEPHQVLMVPLGFGVEVPDGYMAVIKPRSSMNAKGIITQIGTIDSGYRGEVKAVFINATDNEYEFFTNDNLSLKIFRQRVDTFNSIHVYTYTFQLSYFKS